MAHAYGVAAMFDCRTVDYRLLQQTHCTIKRGIKYNKSAISPKFHFPTSAVYESVDMRLLNCCIVSRTQDNGPTVSSAYWQQYCTSLGHPFLKAKRGWSLSIENTFVHAYTHPPFSSGSFSLETKTAMGLLLWFLTSRVLLWVANYELESFSDQWVVTVCAWKLASFPDSAGRIRSPTASASDFSV